LPGVVGSYDGRWINEEQVAGSSIASVMVSIDCQIEYGIGIEYPVRTALWLYSDDNTCVVADVPVTYEQPKSGGYKGRDRWKDTMHSRLQSTTIRLQLGS
jgi:hypothetical protein